MDSGLRPWGAAKGQAFGLRAPSMRLFGRLERIQLRMSATLSLPTLLAAPASLLFSNLMADDTKSLALGLRRRDPELLDRLIEQYQYRLFRYLLYITGN